MMDEKALGQFPFDHAGLGETSLMMAFCPEGVNMGKFSKEGWYAQSAKDASVELGEKGKKLILDHMRAVLRPKEG